MHRWCYQARYHNETSSRKITSPQTPETTYVLLRWNLPTSPSRRKPCWPKRCLAKADSPLALRMKGCLCVRLVLKTQHLISVRSKQGEIHKCCLFGFPASGQGRRLISKEMATLTSPSVELKARQAPASPKPSEASCDPLQEVTFALLLRKETQRCRRLVLNQVK